MRRTTGLVTFLKGTTDPAAGVPGCANYDHRYGGCLFGEACKVEQCKRCGYFEQAVLPTANDVGLGEQVYSLYEKQVDIQGGLERAPKRLCPDCGAELKARQRYCEKCARRRRADSYRERRKKAGRRATLNENCPPNSASKRAFQGGLEMAVSR